MDIKSETLKLINNLKATCQNFGLGNHPSEYEIITQVFLYKFLNDKFGFEIKKISPRLFNAKNWEDEYSKLTQDERQKLFNKLSPNVFRFLPHHLLTNLWNQQQKGDFDLLFDNTLINLAELNSEIFSTQTSANTSILLFNKITNNIRDEGNRANFARALIDKLINFSFEEAFTQHYDFFATIFEYLIKDYNTSGGGTYAEYYTPHSISTIMAKLLVGEQKNLHNIECYDPSAGTGTLLMALAHEVGEEKCTIFSQDISQKSTQLLKLNLIINGFISSLQNVIEGNTLLNPYHKSDDKKELRQFDFVVSNPPFNVDFSGYCNDLKTQTARFWAGVPNIPKKDKNSMAIYTCFLQHVINSLKKDGKAAIVVPTGFITSTSGIKGKILKFLIDQKIIYGCISMPSNVFANTGTNVSILFIDKSKNNKNVVLIDASKMGEEYQENKLKKVRLTEQEIDKIISTFRKHENIDDFSKVVTYEELKTRYSLSPGQYFDIKIEKINITKEQFNKKIEEAVFFVSKCEEENKKLHGELIKAMKGLIWKN